jgi:hypothetical protein
MSRLLKLIIAALAMVAVLLGAAISTTQLFQQAVTSRWGGGLHHEKGEGRGLRPPDVG